jgi:uncharacterized YigZ family protein
LKEHIKTIVGFTETKFKEKGSLFIGHSYPINNETDCTFILEKLRKEFYDATHICYAYRLNDDREKYSDDGEPNGTAGVRILNAIDHFGLTDILLVSIRYYGGTKLGVGPLGKAYYKSAFDTIENAKVLTVFPYYKIRIYIEVSFVKTIFRILSNSKIIQSDYDKGFFIDAYIPCKEYEKINSEIQTVTKGKSEILFDKTVIYLEKE